MFLFVVVADSVTPFINDIQIEDVVVDDGLQIITGNKIISNKFYVRGDLSANRVNGHSLKTLHQQTIFTKNNETIKGNIVRSQLFYHLFSP